MFLLTCAIKNLIDNKKATIETLASVVSIVPYTTETYEPTPFAPLRLSGKTTI